MKAMWRFVLMAMLAAGLVLGQAPERPRQAGKQAAVKPPAASTGIVELAVTGNKRFTDKQILALSGLRPGMEPTQSVFEAARDRLLASGGFASVGWRYEPLPSSGYRATIEVEEIDQVLPWMVDRLPVTAEEFAAQASAELPLFGKELPASDAYLSRAAAVLQRLAEAKGFHDQVVGLVNLVGKDRLVVIFQPKTPPPKIARVQVEGSRVVPKGDLQKTLNEVAVGTPFTEYNFRFLFENQARPLFEAYGRLQARLISIKAEPAKDVAGVIVTAEVEEGEEFKLAGVEVLGTPYSTAEIDELAQWPVGKTANYSAVGIGVNKLLAKMKRQGYLKAAYKAERRLNVDAKEVQLIIRVEAGPQFRMGKLSIVGLDLESEPVIRKMYTNKTGDPFDAEYPDEFLKMVRDRGIFDFLGATKSATKVDENTKIVDVTLTFQGEDIPKQQRRRRGI